MSATRQRPVSAAELSARAAELARPPEQSGTARGDEVAVIVMQLGPEWFAIRASEVREVVAHPALTPIPLTPKSVAGVMNLRGEIVAAFDLASLLTLDAQTTAEPVAVVVMTGETSAAFLVDAVENVETVAEADREPVVPTLAGHEARLFRGAFRHGGRLIGELNVEALLHHDQLEGVRQPADSGRAQ